MTVVLEVAFVLDAVALSDSCPGCGCLSDSCPKWHLSQVRLVLNIRCLRGHLSG